MKKINCNADIRFQSLVSQNFWKYVVDLYYSSVFFDEIVHLDVDEVKVGQYRQKIEFSLRKQSHIGSEQLLC